LLCGDCGRKQVQPNKRRKKEGRLKVVAEPQGVHFGRRNTTTTLHCSRRTRSGLFSVTRDIDSMEVERNPE
jgi:hypothetical protein